jgi:hypothetical protein
VIILDYKNLLSLGVSIYNSDGTFKSLGKVMEELNKVWRKLTPYQQEFLRMTQPRLSKIPFIRNINRRIE